MNVFRWQMMVGLAALLVASESQAQRSLEDPHIGYVYPAGGQLGTTVDAVIGGQYLNGVSEIYISGGGVRATIVKYFRHITQGQYAGLNTRRMQRAYDKLVERARRAGNTKYEPTRDEVFKEANYTEMELEQLADYRKRNAERKRQLNPQLMEDVYLQIRIDKDAKPGERELRLITSAGMSNPMWFMIGQVPETREVEPNDKSPHSAVRSELPLVINGQVMPGDVDRFSIQARKGQRLVATASARELIPYLADAVPGWFQAVLALYDAEGKEVAYAGEFGWRQDPVLYYEVPKDGEYIVEIRDAIYRGREDFVYRITMGELPYVTNVFPLGGRAGTQVTVDLKGWNLPIETLKLENYYDRGKPIRPISVRGKEMVSNRVPFAVDMQPEALDQEPNNAPESAQAVTLPIIVNGRIDPPDDCDVFCFEGRAKEKFVAEVVARRLGSPLDSLLKLTDASGKQIAVNDDYEDKASAMATHHADSRISARLPATGTYYLKLYDSQRKGGPDYAYRLHMRPPRPDFELRVVPSSVIARTGTSVPIAVYVVRKDGFAEEIHLELEKAPPGFKLDAGWVPAGQDKIRMTLTAPPNPTPEPISLEMQGRAVVQGTRLARFAVPAEAMMQAFAYHHLVPAKDWTVAVTGKSITKPTMMWVKEDRIRIPAGKTAQVRAAAPGKLGSELRFELSEPPDGILIEKVAGEKEVATVHLQTDAKAVRPGQKGNLLFNLIWEHQVTDAEGKQVTTRTPMGMLPALPYEIMKP